MENEIDLHGFNHDDAVIATEEFILKSGADINPPADIIIPTLVLEPSPPPEAPDDLSCELERVHPPIVPDVSVLR